MSLPQTSLRFAVLRSARASWLLALGLIGLAPLSHGQTFTDDFNSGQLKPGWTEYNLGAAFQLVGISRPFAVYTFPDDGVGGKAYRIESLVATPQEYAFFEGAAGFNPGPSRAVTYRSENYTSFRATVDLVGWDNGIAMVAALAARIHNIGLGQTAGYLLNYNPADQDLEITSVSGEEGDSIGTAYPVYLRPDEGPYRMVFSGKGDLLIGRVYKVSDLSTPVASVAASSSAYPSGNAGLLAYDDSSDQNYTGADATFDNFTCEPLPAAVIPPQVVQLEPWPFQTATSVPASVKVAIMEWDTFLQDQTIVLTVDGVNVPSAQLQKQNGVQFQNGALLNGLTITYQPPAVANVGGTHTNRITFQDNAGNTVSQEWTYHYAVLAAENAAPSGSGTDPGFKIRLAQSIQSQPLANSVNRAEYQLAEPPLLPVDLVTNTTATVINYTTLPLPNDPPSGYFGNEVNFPGVDPAGNTGYFGVEAWFYLDLPAGTHRLGVRSDDGFQLLSGATPEDPQAMVVAQNLDGSFDGTFELVVPQAGLYPFRFVYAEAGPPGHVEFYEVSPGSGDRTLINDAASTIKAFQNLPGAAVTLWYSASVTGEFVQDEAAQVDAGARTVTTAVTGMQSFYQLQASAGLTIDTVEVRDGQVVLTYSEP